MTTRTLRRRVIIRETDFEKVRSRAFLPIGVHVLYDRAEWNPITREEIERDMIMRGLRGKQMPRGGSWLIPEDYLLYSQDSLYNTKYSRWNPCYDENGFMTVQAKKNLPVVRLGWAVFEKDLESRI
jgi:hypothetical protein